MAEHKPDAQNIDPSFRQKILDTAAAQQIAQIPNEKYDNLRMIVLPVRCPRGIPRSCGTPRIRRLNQG